MRRNRGGALDIILECWNSSEQTGRQGTRAEWQDGSDRRRLGRRLSFAAHVACCQSSQCSIQPQFARVVQLDHLAVTLQFMTIFGA